MAAAIDFALFTGAGWNRTPTWAQFPPAEVEIRVPQAVVGSDGPQHLAYELHITNFYPSAGTLVLKQLTVFTNDGAVPLTTLTAAQLPALLAHPPVLAVAEGVVRDLRDGEPNQVPLAPNSRRPPP